MKVLFIGNSRIGDFVLSTGLLGHLIETLPEPRITVVCGPSSAALLAATPRVERVLALRKLPWSRHWLILWRACAGTFWDLIIDLRSSAMSRLLLARRRCWRRPPAAPMHKVVEAGALLGLDPPPPPRLWLAPEHRARASRLVPPGPAVLALAPGATGRPKQWPAERFAALAQRLTGGTGPLAGARIVLLGAAEERPAAAPVFAAVGADRAIDLIGLPLLAAAACLERCALFVGNDNGAMHMAAAVGVPTLGLFGPTDPRRYGPWGAHAAHVCTQRPFAELEREQRAGATGSLMESLPVEAVEQAALRLLARAAPRTGAHSPDDPKLRGIRDPLPGPEGDSVPSAPAGAGGAMLRPFGG